MAERGRPSHGTFGKLTVTLVNENIAERPPDVVLALAMRARYVWDYDISQQEFDALLAGKAVVGRLDRAWAAARLIDSAPYEEVVRRIGFGELVRHWPEWRSRVRSSSARRGLDFLVEWLPRHHPELLA